jgi:hypothetical protein
MGLERTAKIRGAPIAIAAEKGLIIIFDCDRLK